MKKPCRSDATSSGLAVLHKLNLIPPRKLGKHFVFFALCAGWTCKLSAPAAFVDGGQPVSKSQITGLNFRDGGELPSGFIVGKVPTSYYDWQYALDDGGKVDLTPDATGAWKIKIPAGATAAEEKNRWQVGSKHTLSLVPKTGIASNGNRAPVSSGVIFSFTRQQNKDANGDGYADVIVGASGNNGANAAGGQTAGAANKGAAYVFYGSGTGVTRQDENATPYHCSEAPSTSAPNACTVIRNPDNFGGQFGISVSFAGDVNGDGYADVIVGAISNTGSVAAGGQNATGVPSDKGAAYVFYGSAAGVTRHDENATPYYCSGAPDCTVIKNPDNFGGYFGTSVSSAGDVNGDGYADVIVGANFNDGTNAAGGQIPSGQSPTGAAYVFYGSATGVTRHDENATSYYCSGAPDCTVIQNPDNHTGEFGISVSYAGDVNADGYADVIVGAYGNDGTNAAGGQTFSGQSVKGAAYVFYGSATGVTRHEENATAYYCSGAPDCTVIQNPDNHTGQLGNSVSYAGDVNADGYADVIVGALNNNGTAAAGGQTFSGQTNKGAAYVFYGSATGVTRRDENATAYYCSGVPNGCTVIQNPDNSSTFFGKAVSFAGDVNGDGYADVVVGSTNNGTGAAGGQTAGVANKGAAYVFYGSAIGVTRRDENATPYYCSGASSSCTVIQNPDNRGGQFGVSVSFAGDVNSDGYADVIIGARDNDGTSAAGGQTFSGQTNKGAAYIFYGSATGVTRHDENATPYYCSGPPSASAPNGCTVIQNPDNRLNGLFGISVSFVGDVNGDNSYLAARRLVPASLGTAIPPRTSYGIPWPELAICIRREQDIA